MLRQREDQLAAAREDAERQLVRRKVDLPTSEDIRAYVADFWEFLEGGTFPERKALIRNFVQGIEVSGDEAELTYTIPMPAGGATSERAAVLDFVQSGLPELTCLGSGAGLVPGGTRARKTGMSLRRSCCHS